MFKILCRLPIGQNGIPIYTFAVLLFLAFWVVYWLAWCIAKKKGSSHERYQGWVMLVVGISFAIYRIFVL
jgi:hypothetical protein